MTFDFYGYTVRTTGIIDASLAKRYTARGNPGFWLMQEDGRESFLVTRSRLLIAFFQVEHLSGKPQARLHFQAFPTASPRFLLRGLLKLVPLIEKALASRGTRAVFFTSHSPAMSAFMQENLGYTQSGDGGRDGVIMSKHLDSPVLNGEATQCRDHQISN